MKYHLPDRIVRELCSFAQKYAVTKIVLFGSRARGTNTERSDVDIAVYGGDFDSFYWDVKENIHSLLMFDVVQADASISDELKKEIKAVRETGYQNTDIVNMSEIYFKMADETVFAAENYSERIAIKIRTLELLSVFDMLCLVILIVIQTLAAMKMAVLNKLLEQRAYTDTHTGLPNKSACEELLNNKETVGKHTACIMFDLNNLKIINDTKGHLMGDQLILNFAGLLRNVIPQKDFVGRYGGDEFMVVIYNTSKTEIEDILKQLSREKDRLNSSGNNMPIDYACGWAISDADSECTIQMLLDKADYYMYENKQAYKKFKKS